MSTDEGGAERPVEAPDRYEIIEEIAVGGMAEIYLAVAHTRAGLRRRVALKRILPALSRDRRFVEMFFDEARLAMRLSHANIVHTYDVGEAGDTHYLAMELVDGLTLRELMQGLMESGRQLPVPLACFITMEVCKGLAYAHGRTDDEGRHLCVVHRDMTPPNILLGRDGQVKITDFGLAKALTHANITEPGVVKGKYAYLAPEVANHQKSDQRVDIFAAGVCLWEMLAARRLFLGRDEADTVERVRRCEVPSLPPLNRAVSHELDAIVARALSAKPSERTTTARDLGDALARHLFENNLKVTSYDLASFLEDLNGAPDEEDSEAAVGALIDAEIHAQEAVGHLSSHGLSGQEPLSRASFVEIGAKRHDFDGFWSLVDLEPVHSMDEPIHTERTPTIQAMEAAASPSDLAKMLEGGPTQSTTEALAVSSPTVGPLTQASRGEGRWIWVALLVVAVASYVFFGT